MGGHIGCMGEARNAYNILVGKPEGKDHFEYLGVGGNILLKWIGRWGRKLWTGCIWPRIWTGGGSL